MSPEENKSIKNSMPNKLTLAVLAKMSEVSEKNEIFPGDNNNNDCSQGSTWQIIWIQLFNYKLIK